MEPHQVGNLGEHALTMFNQQNMVEYTLKTIKHMKNRSNMVDIP